MEVPRKIAKSARLTGAKKLIHFSAAGVAYNSESLDLQTKFYGEQMVRDEFPDAIIIRPTLVLSLRDYYLKHYYQMINHWYSFIPVWDDCTALKQPIIVDDFVEAIVNAIKLDDIQGKTFEIGGPFQYTQKEILEVMMNAMCRQVKLYKFNKELGKTIGSYTSFAKMNREDIVKSGLDLIVKQENGEGNIHDLYVQPAPVVPFIKKYYNRLKDVHAMKKEDSEA
jgi:nucleoside-diphosphate-sugar epimerase